MNFFVRLGYAIVRTSQRIAPDCVLKTNCTPAIGRFAGGGNSAKTRRRRIDRCESLVHVADAGWQRTHHLKELPFRHDRHYTPQIRRKPTSG
jgi:hypothetical protein